MRHKLTVQRKAFCVAYLEHYNATRAAIKAGYARRSAGISGNKLLKVPEVREYIRELQDRRLKESFVTAARIETELSKLAFSNIMDYIDVKSFVRDADGVREADERDADTPQFQRIQIKDLKEIDTAAVQEIKQTRSGIQIKLHSKDQALEKLMRRKGMFEVDNSQQRPIIVVGDPQDDGDDE